MGALQLVNRLISGEAEITGEKLRRGNLSDQEFKVLHERIKKLAKAPIYIDDTPSLSIFELRAKARRLKEQNHIEMIVIDYLQLIRPLRGKKNETVALGNASAKGVGEEAHAKAVRD